ncbi:MAG: single-stranded-DNA-specific exonuclease RecJ [Clostridiales bacterium]|nr:single-stranded-DNA-specific exonuclease RecJ [Clostridiales bacterium]
MKYKQWHTRPGQDRAAEIEQAGIPSLTARVLAARGCRTAQEARAALACGPELLHDPMELRGMAAAVERIRRAVRDGERICVYGDYDVDGITSTCLLTTHLRAMGGKVLPYVPNRLSEGYSLNRETLLELREQKISLIVTVDCGITNLEETVFARELGMDVVVTDHHACKPDLPDACAVVNPHQPGCPYPFKHLAGVGVALKVALALTPPAQRRRMFLAYADLAAIGTVADVMDLTGENRAIVAMGLEQLQRTRRPGLRALLQETGLEDKTLTATSISYSLAPRMNAAGRMGCPDLTVHLLMTDDPTQARADAQRLCELNRERQAVELEIFEQCAALLEQHPSMREHIIILAGENWHQGVVGIVASRLVERYQMPVVMICMENGKGKGSCRSNGGFSLFEALEQCADLLETFGGHEQAAGFTIPAGNLSAFRARMTAIAAAAPPPADGHQQLDIDVALPNARELTIPQVEALQSLEPYGIGNPRPTFLLEGAWVLNCSCVGGGRHTRFQLEHQGVVLDAIFFSCSLQETGLQPGSQVDVAFYPQINAYRGSRTVQLLITDLRRSLSPIQRDLLLYQRYQAGEPLPRQELRRLVPQRRNFVAVWRYIARPGGPSTLSENPLDLARHVSAAAGWNQPCSTTLVCLEVFQERGLIDLRWSSRQVQVCLRQQEGKVDLDASAVLQKLLRQIEGDEMPEGNDKK